MSIWTMRYLVMTVPVAVVAILAIEIQTTYMAHFGLECINDDSGLITDWHYR